MECVLNAILGTWWVSAGALINILQENILLLALRKVKIRRALIWIKRCLKGTLTCLITINNPHSCNGDINRRSSWERLRLLTILSKSWPPRPRTKTRLVFRYSKRSILWVLRIGCHLICWSQWRVTQDLHLRLDRDLKSRVLVWLVGTIRWYRMAMRHITTRNSIIAIYKTRLSLPPLIVW